MQRTHWSGGEMEPLFIWDDGPGGNVEHIAPTGITPEDCETVVRDPRSVTDVSDSSGYPITFGYTEAGEHIAVVWEQVDDDPRTVYVVTAYPTPPRRRRRRR